MGYKTEYVKYLMLTVISLMIGFSCRTPKPGNFDLPEPKDTFDKPVAYQNKTVYSINGVHTDNLFDGARLNGFEKMNDTTYRAVISPENMPINASAYFSFRIWSDRPRNIDLELFYTEHEHRYIPKLSLDGRHWVPMNPADFDTLKAGNIATLRLSISPDTLWVSGQEVINSSMIYDWAKKTAVLPHVYFQVIGKSKLGRDMVMMDIWQETPKKKNTIVILGRQHPPEVTGNMAMESFVEELLSGSRLSRDFIAKHRILIFPLMNPDGVDLGHWRHNAGGIDLNRDWAYYRQEEVRVVANKIVETAYLDKNDVILGLDFHSTQQDLYYTFDESMISILPGFKDYWLEGIDEAFDDYTPDDQPYGLESPISKAWFYLQFDAESITYEIGDETPREFVREKATKAAQEMMKLLIYKED